jgi:hypothetical protein
MRPTDSKLLRTLATGPRPKASLPENAMLEPDKLYICMGVCVYKMKCSKCGKDYYFPLLHLRNEHGIPTGKLLRDPDHWLKIMEEWQEK